jgi:hypothetical protein
LLRPTARKAIAPPTASSIPAYIDRTCVWTSFIILPFRQLVIIGNPDSSGKTGSRYYLIKPIPLSTVNTTDYIPGFGVSPPFFRDQIPSV